MHYDAVLGPSDPVPGRPFTDPEHTASEERVMAAMLERQREIAQAWREPAPEASNEHVVDEYDEEGKRHLLAVPDKRALLEARDFAAVGFFSRPRQDVDHGILFELETELVARMPTYARVGLLSYYDVELVKGAYGNLILFSTPDVPPEWHREEVHRQAVQLSPGHYHEVRLHKGTVPGPFLGGGTVTIDRTKYFDFADGGWRGVRNFEADR